MEKFSVKKPFTILVAVIMVLLLGFVSITNLQTNLLPDISTPYLMVVTVYPGASPERVESEVSDVMENALGTVSGVESITATSAENYSLLLMKFAEGTDMNSAMVKTSNKVDQTASSLPGTCLTPSIIEYSLNMNAFMTVAVSREGSDVYDLSDFVESTLVPYVGRTSGVSSVSANGLIEKMVQVQLNQDKIDEVNARLLELIDTQLADARAQLDDAEAQIAAGRAEYEKQLKNFGDTVSDTVMAQMGTEVADAVTVVRDQAQALLSSINQLIGVVNEPEISRPSSTSATACSASWTSSTRPVCGTSTPSSRSSASCATSPISLPTLCRSCRAVWVPATAPSPTLPTSWKSPTA